MMKLIDPATLSTELAFQRSYEDFEHYPSNLVQKQVSKFTLELYEKQLRDSAEDLFHEDVAKIPIWDAWDDGQVQKNEIEHEDQLRSHLGDDSSNRVGNSTQVAFSLPDPKCRMVFLSAYGNSSKPLKITDTMTKRIASFHQVMHNFVDFITVFGRRAQPANVHFSSFIAQKQLSKIPQGLGVPSLGRSGRQYQLCYNLKTVAVTVMDRVDERTKLMIKVPEWSPRQAAIHHQFDLVTGRMFWMFVQGHGDIRRRMAYLIEEGHGFNLSPSKGMAGCLNTVLVVHIMLCEWSVENWRQYLQYLEDTLTAMTISAITNPESQTYSADDLIRVQHHEEKVDQAIALLEANSAVLSSLHDFYMSMRHWQGFQTPSECQEQFLIFSDRLQSMITDSKLQIGRAKLHARSSSNRKALILQHLEAQNTKRMESSAIRMHRLGYMAQRETIAMRVLALVTLVYLPGTFVSSFFSTDIVKYQDGTNYSQEAMDRWLQVTLPLTAVTCLLALVFYLRSAKNLYTVDAKAATLPPYAP